MPLTQHIAADTTKIAELGTLIRSWILRSTTTAGSGHPTSALSAVELMTALFFDNHFRFDVQRPDLPSNDRLIFSKGHASPLFYALWAAADAIPADDLLTYRQFDSTLEGHPTSRFRFTEAATGSLGQGLSVGVGTALAAKLDNLDYRTFVLLGDSEMAEGSQWEAIQLAAHYKLDNLVALLDVNRLGQRGETMYGHDLETYEQRVSAFGWHTIVVEDGHDIEAISKAIAEATKHSSHDTNRADTMIAPTMIIAKTIKGKGVASLEDENGWHGKAIDEEMLEQALEDLPSFDEELRGELASPSNFEQPIPSSANSTHESNDTNTTSPLGYDREEKTATRDAYGNALNRLLKLHPNLLSLDGEVCNSTRAKRFRDEHKDSFLEMYIAEQNMVGVATGLALRGKLPFVSTFAAFLTRAFDQIRMTPHSEANVKFVGSHCGVSIGHDGPSQMGLEDIAMFRTLQNCAVLYPCDAICTERLVELMANYDGIAYLRTTRGKTPIIYHDDETFEIGGSKTIRYSDNDQVTILAAGITLHESLTAYDQLKDAGINVRVIDLYSIKPLDHATVRRAADETKMIFTVEDHYPEGGIGEAVLTSLSDHPTPVRSLAVRKRPKSGTPQQLLDYEGISAQSIVEAVKAVA